MTDQTPAAPTPPPPPPYPPYPPHAYSFGSGAVPPGRGRGRTRLLRYGAGGAAVVTACALAFAVGTTQAHTKVVRVPQASTGFGSTGFGSGTGQDPFGQLDPYDPLGQSNGSGGSGGTGTATSAQQVGVVDITTNLKYQGAEAAGTGMVLDSSGDVLTNNHVVNGATSIRVTVVSTGRSYTAKVVGTDPTQDIAVIKLANASGLTPANFGDSSSVRVGDTVTGVGNAGGAGGTPSAATGTVTALNQSITAADDGGGNAEKLPNVMVSNAGIQSGDSGGPLYNSKNQVIGIDTAANTSGTTQGFSIPINTALSIAHQIETGPETTSIHLGYPAFLGVSVSSSDTGSGVLVNGVVSGGPAARAGLAAGDRITRVGSTSTATASALTAAMAKLEPGDHVTVTYLDASGRSHTVTLTTATGPAD
jgi:S1-C subfamily serine protease